MKVSTYHILCLLLLVFFTSSVHAQIYLDADSPETGSLLKVAPLVTPYGTISFFGDINNHPFGDTEFIAAGASGNVFNICVVSCDDPPNDVYYEQALLTFDFDIYSATFIYGGNSGVFDIEARDISGGVVDSFYQASTLDAPAGPITLSGYGIRSLYWTDIPGNTVAAIDNVIIETTVVPEPISSTLFIVGGATLGFRRSWKKKKIVYEW